MTEVNDLESALAALEEIVEQGEGTARGDVWDGDQDIFHPDRDEAAHYYRFQELRLGGDTGAVTRRSPARRVRQSWSISPASTR